MFVGVSCVCRSDPIHCTMLVGVSCVCRSDPVHRSGGVRGGSLARGGAAHGRREERRIRPGKALLHV